MRNEQQREHAVSVRVQVGTGGGCSVGTSLSRRKALETHDGGGIIDKPFLGKAIWRFYTGELLRGIIRPLLEAIIYGIITTREPW